jgi:beta-xylosidase
VGGRYFLACSSFEYFPGVPLFVSDDLRQWRQLGNVLDRPEQLSLVDAPSSGGVYAPTLRHHNGQFWLITTNVSDGGHLIVTATDPAGPWSDPIRIDGLTGIDPDLAWDSDGTCWLTYASQGIHQVPINPYRGTVLDTPRQLWSGTGRAFPEAPHIYHIDRQWYLLIAEGGTERGHCVSVARGPSPRGPFHGHPANPILSHSGTNSPVQNTGHGDLVRAVDGSWWMVLLGVRPHGGTPGFHVLGRETFLTPVRWKDGWPVPAPVVLGDAGCEPVAAHDDFDANPLGPQWISIRTRSPHTTSLAERPGWLVLRAQDPSLDDAQPTFVGRRQQHPCCRVRARVDATAGRGGLSIRVDERHHYELQVEPDEVSCVARIGPLTQRLASVHIGSGPVVLCLDISAGSTSLAHVSAPPDRIRLGFERDGRTEFLAELDGRYLSTEVAGGFTGRVIGMYAVSGTVAFDWFDYTAD